MKEYLKKANLKNRLIIFTLTIQFFLLMIVIRLWYLQIINKHVFQKMSLENRSRFVSIKAPRGRFFDSEGTLLVNNKPAYFIAVIPEDIKENKAIIPKLCKLLDITPRQIEAKLKKSKKNPFQPMRLKDDNVGEEIISIIEENKKEYPGVIIIVEPRRSYIRGDIGAHFFGHIGEINDKELKKSVYKDYRQGDIIGKTGIEKIYEKYLKGNDGTERIEVNALGQQINSNVLEEPVQGYNLILSIDKNLQEIAEKAMEGKAGAIVAINPQNGGILSMVSKPCFDPNMFAGQISSEEWNELNTNPLHPLLNRVSMGAYPPGSTFKTVVAIAALEEGIITEENLEFCNGEFFCGNMKYKCWKKEGHGAVNVSEALINSCNIFFYKLALRMGVKKIEKYARLFGLGEKTNIDLEQERQGLVPNPAWKKNAVKEPWYPGDDISMGVGQNALLVTPLQMVNLISSIFNGGKFFNPHLVKKIVAEDNKILFKVSESPVRTIQISDKTLNIIKDALWKVVNRNGTGRRARIPGLNIAGKSGTAQIVVKEDIYDNVSTDKIPEHIRPHAWFISCAPSENPKIAIAVLVEHGGEGGQTCAPIAMEMYKEYLKDEKKDYTLDYVYHCDDIPRGEIKISMVMDSTKRE